MNNDKCCARCGEGTFKSWSELNDDEREVVKRLPSSADFRAAERQSAHRWCTRCWFESVGTETQA